MPERLVRDSPVTGYYDPSWQRFYFAIRVVPRFNRPYGLICPKGLFILLKQADLMYMTDRQITV